MNIELSYPPKLCWPNNRTRSYRAKAADVAKARKWAAVATREVMPGCFNHNGGAIPIKVFCYPKPRGRVPDGDNVNSACKAYFDGIADALGVNDKHFVVAPPVMMDRRQYGKIVVVVGGDA